MTGPGNSDLESDAAMRLLCRTQTQLMVAENAALLARMAAALSHELNSPLGALAGALQTLRSVLARIARGERIDPSLAAELDGRLDGAIRDAMQRVHQVISRMQRIANLYGAKTYAIPIDELISDVIALLDPKLKFARAVRLELQPALAVECHPEQISAVLSALLYHLLELQPEASEIIVRASRVEELVTIAVSAPELVLANDQVTCLLQPGLQASRCTWNLFGSRQILLAHGGDLVIHSSPELGTQFTLLLPVRPRQISPNSDE